MQPEPVYLDNASTTAVDPAAAAAMLPYLGEQYGNAASKYYELGREANAAVEKARAAVAELVGAAAPEEIYFTSGATEANNWVVRASLAWGDRKHAISSRIEHHAILEPLEFLRKRAGVAVDLLPVDGHGLVDPDALRGAMRPDTGLVSIMLANNEMGTLEDVPALVAAAREAAGGEGALFHTDAVQVAGKLPVDAARLGVDALSLSAHKFHGPKGVGALWVRKGVKLAPDQFGGHQENRKRAGTANVAGIVGMGVAAELALRGLADAAEAPRQSALVEKLWQGLAAGLPKIRRNGHPEKRLPNILSVCVQGAEGEAVLGYLDMLHAIQVSSGSACTSGSLEPSHVLLALGVPVEIAHGSIRFSLSRHTTAADIDRTIPAVIAVVERVRAMSVTWVP